LWEQRPRVVGTNLWLWEAKKYMVVGTKTYICGNKYMVVGTKTYGCGNKIIGCGNINLWMWEQKQIFLATKHMIVGTKPRVVGTITYGCGNKSMVWEQKNGCENKKDWCKREQKHQNDFQNNNISELAQIQGELGQNYIDKGTNTRTW
jgi:hypothetical protein